MKNSISTLLTLIIFGLTGCGEEKRNSDQVQRDTQVYNYGSNVFSFSERSFAKTLAEFLAKHPNLEVAAMCPRIVKKNYFDGEGAGDERSAQSANYAGVDEYIVVFREKPLAK